VRVLRADGTVVCRGKALPTVESLVKVEQAALTGATADTRLEIVIEPTGPAWLPIVVFFSGRGHTVYRVSSAKAADLRRFLRRHAKSNGIDADTLARLPLVDPAGLRPLELPDAPRAALDRRVRACDRLTQAAATHKRRIKDLVRQLLPASPVGCQKSVPLLGGRVISRAMVRRRVLSSRWRCGWSGPSTWRWDAFSSCWCSAGGRRTPKRSRSWSSATS
jgi:hypothetical protein